ncbi:unnamed protein product [Ixodes pacificus]
MLVFETRVLSPDARVRAEHTRPNSWLLRIAQVRTSDAGLYACVVDSTPRLSQLGALEVRPLRQVTVHKDEPYFAEPIPSLTVAAGRNAALKCVVENLGNYTVAWLNVDKQTLLALHTHVIVQNDRIRVSHGSLRSWQLEIRDVKPEDTGYYMCQVNTRPMKNQVGYLNVVVAPYFVDAFTARNLTARENSNASFRCEASGNPEPKITWRREDGQSFRLGDQKATTSGITRHEGPFFDRCSRISLLPYFFTLENQFRNLLIAPRIRSILAVTPMIWVPNQVVGAALGSSVALECHTEAHPASENFWFRSSRRLDGDASANGLKHKKPKRHEASTTKTGLKVYMKLSIWNLRKEDYGTYHCVAQNALDRTEGKIQLHEIAAPSGKTEQPPELPVPVTTSERNQVVDDRDLLKPPSSDVVPGPRQTDKGQGRWAIQHFQDGSHEKKESSRGRAGNSGFCLSPTKNACLWQLAAVLFFLWRVF